MAPYRYKSRGPSTHQLLKKIPVDAHTILKHQFWLDLYQQVKYVIEHRQQKSRWYRSMRSDGHPTKKEPKWFKAIADSDYTQGGYNRILNHYLNILNKRYNLKIRFYQTPYDSAIGPQKCLKAYYTQDDGETCYLIWCKPEEMEVNIESRQILWCKYDNNWWSRYSCKPIYSQTNNKITIITAALPPLQNKSKVQTCPYCDHIWFTGHFLYHKKTEIQSCPQCHQREINNPVITHKFVQTYHSSRETWIHQIQRTSDPKDTHTIPMGIELEIFVHHPKGPEIFARDILGYQYSKPELGNNIYFETDASLGTGGIECISNPMTLSYHQQYWPGILTQMRQGAVGWNIHKHTFKQYYGIHITFNRRYFSDLNLIRFQHFWQHKENTDFVHAIAQRAITYGEKVVGGKEKLTVSSYDVVHNGKLGPNKRAGHLNIKGELVEIRVFQSTLNTESFLKNLEFVDAFQAYCRETAYNIHYQNFLLWLMSKPSNLFRYKHLISYLHRTTYAVKFRVEPVASSWANLMQLRPYKMHHKQLPDYISPTKFLPTDEDYVPNR